jgi:glucuronate isomerase
MKNFLDENFLLQTNTATDLFHNYAAKMPIIDYHCHLNPKEIAENKQYENITQVWLNGDHYKWRAMRTNGIDEKYITGNASDYEKFEKWAETVPYTLRNPLYHWTHLELQRYFDIHEILNPNSAKKIFDITQEKLTSGNYSTRKLLQKMNVEVVCTTDDPIDSLEYHAKIAKDGFSVKVLPTWRPDKAMAIDNVTAFNEYLNKLEIIANQTISEFNHLITALRNRQQYFHDHGCRMSDHGLDTIYAEPYHEHEVNAIFKKARNGDTVDLNEVARYKSAILHELALMNHEKGWAQQFHIGPLRNNNSRMFKAIGPDTGFDSIGDLPIAQAMSRFFDRLDSQNQLAKSIIYNTNPADNEIYACMLGNFQDGKIAGKIQWGSAWWFLDQKDGIEKQINTLSNFGLLSRFVGMLTDSRSFLSFPRHEYFRRILCNIIGTDVENGELPNDMSLLGTMVQDICYNNAKKYFEF